MQKLVEARWEMLHTALHAAGYLLDPEYHGEEQEQNAEVMAGFHAIVAKLLENEDDQAEAIAQYETYRTRAGLFALPAAWAAARRMSPHAWWLQFGAGVSLLQYIAIRVTAQVSPHIGVVILFSL